MNTDDYIWSVFVDGSEVNDQYMRYNEAREAAYQWLDDGYDEVWLIDTDGNEVNAREAVKI